MQSVVARWRAYLAHSRIGSPMWDVASSVTVIRRQDLCGQDLTATSNGREGRRSSQSLHRKFSLLDDEKKSKADFRVRRAERWPLTRRDVPQLV